MIEIFAHRAIFNGIENSAKSIPYYKKLGIGIELDLRYNNNQVYISHDPTNNGDFFEDVCKQYDKSSIKLALHIKENEALNPTIKILEKYSIKNYFLFNTENFEYSKFDGATPYSVRGPFLWVKTLFTLIIIRYLFFWKIRTNTC